jgi:hypothetical protein
MSFEDATWTLCELLAWVALRDPDAIAAASAAPSIQVTKIDICSRRRLGVAEAENEIRRNIISGRLQCTAVRDGRRVSVGAEELMAADFLYTSGAARDRTSGEIWHDLTFFSHLAITLWPIGGPASVKPIEVPAAPAEHPRKNPGGRPSKWSWDQFWIEVTLWAAANDLVHEDSRRELTNHMNEWFAENNGGDSPSDSSIRSRIKDLFDRFVAAGR